MLTYISLELMTTLYSLLAVSLFLASPADCPRMFGDLRGAFTVRQAWAVVWHQQMRRLCSAPGVWIARDFLKLGKGSFASKYVQLFVGFAVSGAVHAGAAMLAQASTEEDGAMGAFMAQVVIIFVEDHVIAFGRRCGFKESGFWRGVGYVWVVVAFGTSLMGWSGRNLGRGLWVHDRERDFFGIGPE